MKQNVNMNLLPWGGMESAHPEDNVCDSRGLEPTTYTETGGRADPQIWHKAEPVVSHHILLEPSGRALTESWHPLCWTEVMIGHLLAFNFDWGEEKIKGGDCTMSYPRHWSRFIPDVPTTIFISWLMHSLINVLTNSNFLTMNLLVSIQYFWKEEKTCACFNCKLCRNFKIHILSGIFSDFNYIFFTYSFTFHIYISKNWVPLFLFFVLWL